MFAVLPFGLSAAPYLFTKLMRPLVRFWRARGLKAIMYLDDGICAVEEKKEADLASQFVRDTLNRAGLVVNVKKSSWNPSHCMMWLGFNIDLSHGCISVLPEKRLSQLHKSLNNEGTKECLAAKQIASIVGKIISMSLALGPIARFMTRSLYVLIESRDTWCDLLEVTPEARVEMEFWRRSLSLYNGQPIWCKPSAVAVVYSDASDIGYGGYTVHHGYHVVHGNWGHEEAAKSSTWRELVAVGRVLEAIALFLKVLHVRWFSDNQNVVRIIQHGSRKPHLQVEALKILEICIKHQIHIEPDWVPRGRTNWQTTLAEYQIMMIGS